MYRVAARKGREPKKRLLLKITLGGGQTTLKGQTATPNGQNEGGLGTEGWLLSFFFFFNFYYFYFLLEHRTRVMF